MMPLIDVEWMLKRSVTAVEKICGCVEGMMYCSPLYITRIPSSKLCKPDDLFIGGIGLDDSQGTWSKLNFAITNTTSIIPPIKDGFNRHSIICLPCTPSNALDRVVRYRTGMQRELLSQRWFHLPVRLARNIAPLGNTTKLPADIFKDRIPKLKHLYHPACIPMKSIRSIRTYANTE